MSQAAWTLVVIALAVGVMLGLRLLLGADVFVGMLTGPG
jgi:hypothetical protein